ncbi:type II toxin-antitoxin system Phd/YefM family antitoxin [Pseudomonas sp. FEN]|uniref:type II toxin-antitoxin system Phd/YefM family antitoxin n=1 Tax=Pseudomonas sp. FEN TaxID=2767468 RepID=UPI001CD2139C|nr:type II toxin-antitoxin system Phd/YefM family antitoxin [Pseudomonas sp. FEN]
MGNVALFQAAEAGAGIACFTQATVRGKPAHVLLSVEEYQRLAGGNTSIIDVLAMPGVEDIAFDPPRAVIHQRPADLS